jgi:hypothetical protein
MGCVPGRRRTDGTITNAGCPAPRQAPIRSLRALQWVQHCASRQMTSRVDDAALQGCRGRQRRCGKCGDAGGRRRLQPARWSAPQQRGTPAARRSQACASGCGAGGIAIEARAPAVSTPTAGHQRRRRQRCKGCWGGRQISQMSPCGCCQSSCCCHCGSAAWPATRCRTCMPQSGSVAASA